MVDVIEFKEAVTASNGKDRALLIGNGFSAEYFSYRSLLAASGIGEGSALRNVFAALDTVDFEKVVRALEDASVIEGAYGHEARASELVEHAQQVREALVKAVNETHPAHRKDLGEKYAPSSKFIELFSTVFSLNYDLLLYWVNLEKQSLRDGFGLGRQNGNFLGPFSPAAHCALYNLHGGLHLFAGKEGELFKALDSGDGVIATITQAIGVKKRMPTYVAEGSSSQKMAKINSVPYLRHAYDKLRENAAPLFVYGHSADENDSHIYRAVFESEAKHIYFGVFKPDAEKLKALDGQMAKYQRIYGDNTEYTFFDSETAAVWG